MSPVKLAAKRAVRYNLIVGAVVVLFAAWAINKAQSIDLEHRIDHAVTVGCISDCR